MAWMKLCMIISGSLLAKNQWKEVKFQPTNHVSDKKMSKPQENEVKLWWSWYTWQLIPLVTNSGERATLIVFHNFFISRSENGRDLEIFPYNENDYEHSGLKFLVTVDGLKMLRRYAKKLVSKFILIRTE